MRLPGKGNSNSHGARPAHQIISMIKWIRTISLSIKISLFFLEVGADLSKGGGERKCDDGRRVEWVLVRRAEFGRLAQNQRDLAFSVQRLARNMYIDRRMRGAEFWRLGGCGHDLELLWRLGFGSGG
jgi:hypothetical protein